jgi:hypothetical protein
MAKIDRLLGRFALEAVEQAHKGASGERGLLRLAHL